MSELGLPHECAASRLNNSENMCGLIKPLFSGRGASSRNARWPESNIGCVMRSPLTIAASALIGCTILSDYTPVAVPDERLPLRRPPLVMLEQPTKPLVTHNLALWRRFASRSSGGIALL